MRRKSIIALVVVVLAAGLVLAFTFLVPARMQPAMGGQAPTVPPVKGYSEGMEIHFIHTEASDEQVAGMLTDMMGSPVLVVPSLAQANRAMVANVYVFTNGVEGEGPFGFQADVFDSPPGHPGYSPLRTLNLVEWQGGQSARVLKSATEVAEAEAKGEVATRRPGVVINAPMLTWPGGQR